MIAVKEQTINISQYLHQEGDTEVHIFIGGFLPMYNPICCVKGKPETMKELLGKLEEVLGVNLSANVPSENYP